MLVASIALDIWGALINHYKLPGKQSWNTYQKP